MDSHSNKISVKTHRSAPEPKSTAINSYKKVILLTVGAVALVFLSAWLVLTLLSADRPKSDRYQVVVLSTGQIYFGKLKNTVGSYLTLDNVYYSKAQELPADATEEQKKAAANNTTLVKMGSEVYGPESTLRIRTEQVLFWQNLTADSKVSKAIDTKK